MAAPSLSSKSCANLEIRLPNISSIESAQVSATHNSQWLQHTGKTSLSNRLRSRYAQKRGYLPSQGMHNSRFLQQVISCTKTREEMAPSDRPKCSEQLSAGSHIQDGKNTCVGVVSVENCFSGKNIFFSYNKQFYSCKFYTM